jgi:hypothetical protein
MEYRALPYGSPPVDRVVLRRPEVDTEVLLSGCLLLFLLVVLSMLVLFTFTFTSAAVAWLLLPSPPEEAAPG